MNRFTNLMEKARQSLGRAAYFKPLQTKDDRPTSYCPTTEWSGPNKKDLYIFTEGPDINPILALARKMLGSDGYVRREMNGTFIARRGQNTIQIWEQTDESLGADQYYWMKVRGPAFDDEDLFPVESYRLTESRMTTALRRMTS